MRYFLIKATKKRGRQAEFIAVQEMGDVQTLMEEYQKAELAMYGDAPVLPYSLFLRDEDDVLNAMGRKFVEISNELNNDIRRN